jgi:hypothetical protein
MASAATSCERDDPRKAAEILADAVLPSLRAGSPADAANLARRAMRLADGAGGHVEFMATLLLGTHSSSPAITTRGPRSSIARTRWQLATALSAASMRTPTWARRSRPPGDMAAPGWSSGG